MPTLTDQLTAKAQSFVAKFLASKEVIVNAQNSPNPATVNAANDLMQKQLALEAQLPAMLKKTDGIKAGNYSYGDLLDLGMFVNDLQKHISKVDNLKKQPAGATSVETPFQIPKNILLYGGIAVALAGAYFIFSRNKRGFDEEKYED